MPVRPDVNVDWGLSPRVITVDSPSVEITIQDLVDTLRGLEDELNELDDDSILNADGKTEIGGGNTTGITLTLLNAKLAFEQRTVPTTTGDATSNDVTGTILTDTLADFVVDGIEVGDTVWNVTDGSFATITEIIGVTQLRSKPLSGGVDDEWAIGDDYRVYKTVQCVVNGGNLVALDDIGDPMSPIHPTAFTQVTIELSTSASIAGANISEDIWAALTADNQVAGSFGEKVARLRANRV